MSGSTERVICYFDSDNLPANFVLPPALSPRSKRLSERNRQLRQLAVWAFCARRHLQWRHPSARLAMRRSKDSLPVRVLTHNSLLLRSLGQSEMWMQHNKVHNLRLACKSFNGLIIAPGETFSFWRALGNATARRGYKTGMVLSGGKVQTGVGGGLCQMANLLHWMFLHSPLQVVERSEHSFDPFPDRARVLPWGVGCSVSYNYVDLQFYNPTDITFEIRVAVGEKHLEGELRADKPLPHSYSVFARNEEFLHIGERWFRRNEIWRSVIDRNTGVYLYNEKLKSNCALVCYVPEAMTLES